MEKVIMEETIILLLMNELIQQDSIYSASSRLVLFCCRGNGNDGKVTNTFCRG